MIEIRGVSKKFGDRLALDALDLTVPRGEIFGLLGHNGAGKSTAIGILLGHVWPTAGSAKICGHDVAENRQLALHKVGAIFESPAFYDYLSGWRNLEILSHYTSRCPAARIHEVIEWVGLSGREQGAVRTYSHGMRARLALAQALLPDPELLVLDEPGDGLDPEGIHEMRQTILRLRRELGLTILLSSHLLAEVELLCTSIAVMNEGRKVFEGSLAETRGARGWLRLRAGNFQQAAAILLQEKLIEQARDEKFILPAGGIGADQIVERLVAGGQRVFEIAPQEESLEDFYLSLMKK